jgi:sterol desaturase/sphingolipid hydroxylase (fatty acid hydroxylase superfamily)
VTSTVASHLFGGRAARICLGAAARPLVDEEVRMSVTAVLGSIGVGMVSWTFGEYVLHRFAMHAAGGKGLASREHLRHHAERDSILERWPLAWTGIVIIGVALALVGRTVVGAPGTFVGVGWVASYGFYDWMHWRAHRRPIATRYERWLRRHHFHHHFGHPLVNHGVTTPIWDVVFRTYERPSGPVRVPRRLAMVWLCDDAGAVRPRYAGDFVLAGARPLDEVVAAEDWQRAFANLPPRV